MKKVLIVCIIVAVCAACGGSQVDKAISQVEKALEKVEKNKGKMTEDDWRALEKEVEAPLKVISDALDDDKVGVIGKVKILAVTAKWATVLAEAGMSELEKRTGVERENWAGEIERATQEAGSQLEQAVKEFESEHGTTLEQALEQAAKELEGSDLAKALEQIKTPAE